jgi:hypothetical protein
MLGPWPICFALILTVSRKSESAQRGITAVLVLRAHQSDIDFPIDVFPFLGFAQSQDQSSKAALCSGA